MTLCISSLDLVNPLVLSRLPYVSLVTKVALPLGVGWLLAESSGEQLGLMLPITGQAALGLVTCWLSMVVTRSMGARLLEA